MDDEEERGQEGTANVPGARLRYRLAGSSQAPDVVVIESGWSASFPYAVWLEQALSPHARVLSYDRAGVGDSRALAPLTVEGITQHLLALLDQLKIDRRVVVVGHSYGGLVAALHAALAPTRVRGIVQIDPTPEFDDELVAPSYRSLPVIGRFMQLCAWLKIDGPVFMHTAKELPADTFARMKRNPSWLARSIGGSIAEARLIDGVRAVVTASESAKLCPRLVISSAPGKVPDSWLRKLLMNEEKAHRYWDAVHSLHRRQASLNDASRWMSERDNHISLVTNRATAQRVAASIVDFMRIQEKQ